MVYCVNCKYCDDPTASYLLYARCALGKKVSPVTGQGESVVYCFAMRAAGARCGPDGVLFEARRNYTSEPPAAFTPAANPEPQNWYGGRSSRS